MLFQNVVIIKKCSIGVRGGRVYVIPEGGNNQAMFLQECEVAGFMLFQKVVIIKQCSIGVRGGRVYAIPEGGNNQAMFLQE